MSHPLELEAFLTALREAGVQVGVTEVMRLHQVFALQPALTSGETDEATRRRLQSVMRAILVKSHEERGTFDRVYDNWLAQARHEVQVLTAPPSVPSEFRDDTEGEAQGARPKRRRRMQYGRLAGLLFLVVVTFGLFGDALLPPQQQPGPQTSRPPFVVQRATGADPDAAIDPRKSTFTSYVPQLTVEPPQATRHMWFLGFTGLAFLVAAIVWRVLSRRRWLPAPAPEPTRPGPPRVFLQPLSLTELQFIDTRQQETLVWGIDRFMADEPTRHLDLTATVNATARAGGIPELYFERASYQREVWLWVDEAADDPSIMRLADEVDGILGVHGLPVERATFRGIPEQLVTRTGEVFAPREIDERQDVALVAVLTDGRVLTRQYQADDRRVRINALLRGLSHWPRLAFVDFSDGHGGLAAILSPHDLECIAPMDLAMFLGGGATAGWGWRLRHCWRWYSGHH
jgi:hypothetical protein